MKTLIAISAFLVVSATNLFAQQDSALEIKNLEKKVINNDNNQFKIFSHEDLEVDLKFTLNKLESYVVVISDEKNQIVFTKKIDKEGINKVYFDTKQDEEYTVKLVGEKDINLVALTNKK